MLSLFRTLAKSWISRALLMLLAVALGVWGIKDILHAPPSNEVASGKDVGVTKRQLAQELERALDVVAEQSGEKRFTREEAFKNGLVQEVLESLKGRVAIERFAGQVGIRPSDAMVAKELLTQKQFENVRTGGFDKERYETFLRNIRMTDVEFEDALRQDMARQELGLTLAAGLHAPASVAEFFAAYQAERRAFDAVEIPVSRAAPPKPATEAEIKALYEKAKPQLQTPEFRKLTMIVAQPQDFLAKVVVPEDKLRAAYDFEKSRAGASETRSFVEITAPNETAARDAARRLAAGEEPSAIAKSVGGQVVNMKDAARAKILDPAVAQVVFKLKPGQVSDAVKSSLAGFAAVKVIDAKAGQFPPLEAIRGQLRQALAQDEAMNQLNAAVQAYEDAVSGGATLEAAAKANGLRVESPPELAKNGQTREGRVLDNAAEAKDILEAAFATAEAEHTDFTPLGGAGYAMARVDKIIPAGVLPYEAVKPRLIVVDRNQKIAASLRTVAQKLEAEVKAGKSLAAAAAAMKLRTVASNNLVTRSEAMQGPLARLGQQMFAAPPGTLVSQPVPTGILVAVVTRVERPDVSRAPELLQAARNAAQAALAEDVLVTAQKAAVNAARFKVDQKALQQAIGVSAAANEGDAAS